MAPTEKIKKVAFLEAKLKSQDQNERADALWLLRDALKKPRPRYKKRSPEILGSGIKKPPIQR